MIPSKLTPFSKNYVSEYETFQTFLKSIFICIILLLLCLCLIFKDTYLNFHFPFVNYKL